MTTASSLITSPWRPRLALLTASTAMLLISFNATATNIAFPSIEAEFSDYSLAALSWIVSGFNITLTTMMLIGGRLADRDGRRRIFVTGMAVLAVGSLLVGFAPSVPLLIAARVVQAVGAALVLPSSLAAVLPDYPDDRQASVVSLWAGVGVFGATAAPVIAAGLLELSGWRVVFASTAPIALVAVFAGRTFMSESRPERRPGPLDIIGAATGTAALGLLALAVVQGPRWGWTSPATLGALAGVFVLAPLFIRRCRHHPEPLLDLSLFSVPSFSVTTVASGLLAVSTTATWLLYPLFMDRIWGYSTWQIGLAITPGPAILIVVNAFAGPYADRHGYRRLIVAGSSIACAGTLWLALFFGPDRSYVVAFLPATLLIGTGMGMSMGPMNSAALKDIARDSLAEGNAAFNTVRYFGASIGVALAIAVLGDLDRPDLADAFQRALILLAGIMIVAPLLVTIAYPRDARPEIPSAA